MWNRYNHHARLRPEGRRRAIRCKREAVFGENGRFGLRVCSWKCVEGRFGANAMQIGADLSSDLAFLKRSGTATSAAGLLFRVDLPHYSAIGAI